MSLTNKRTPRSWSSRAHYAQCGDARDRILRAALDTRDTAPTGTKSTRSITIGIQCENNTAVARTRTRNTTRRPIRYLLPRPKLLLLTAAKHTLGLCAMLCLRASLTSELQVFPTLTCDYKLAPMSNSARYVSKENATALDCTLCTCTRPC